MKEKLTVHFPVRLTSSLAAVVDRMAADGFMTKSAVIRLAVAKEARRQGYLPAVGGEANKDNSANGK